LEEEGGGERKEEEEKLEEEKEEEKRCESKCYCYFVFGKTQFMSIKMQEFWIQVSVS
jgi:hypothetical protein